MGADVRGASSAKTSSPTALGASEEAAAAKKKVAVVVSQTVEQHENENNKSENNKTKLSSSSGGVAAAAVSKKLRKRAKGPLLPGRAKRKAGGSGMGGGAGARGKKRGGGGGGSRWCGVSNTFLLWALIPAVVVLFGGVLFVYFEPPATFKSDSKVSATNAAKTASEEAEARRIKAAQQAEATEARGNQPYYLPPGGLPGVDIVGVVPRKAWNWSLTMGRQTFNLATAGEPCVLFDGPGTRWPAFYNVSQKWHPSALKTRLPELSRVYRLPTNSSPFVYRDANKPILAPSDGRAEVSMSGADFFKALYRRQGNDTGGDYVYYTRSIYKSEELAPLREDVRPDFFTLPYGGLNPDFDPEEYTQIWMAQQGMETQLHYDIYHNFYTQLHGEKTFVLVSPGYHTHVYPHPAVHSSARQSQLPMSGKRDGGNDDESAGELLELFGTAHAKVVTLRPGETLFIPAFTYHHVYTVSASVSLNIFAYAPESDLLRSLHSVGLPPLIVDVPEEAALKLERVRMTARLARLAVQAVLMVSDKTVPPVLAAQLYETRYQPLGKAAGCSGSRMELKRCPREGRVTPEHEEHIGQVVEEVTIKFLGLHKYQRNKSMPDAYINGVKETVLYNYLEEVITHVAGPNNICDFLRCLSYSGAWRRSEEEMLQDDEYFLQRE